MIISPIKFAAVQNRFSHPPIHKLSEIVVAQGQFLEPPELFISNNEIFQPKTWLQGLPEEG